MNPKHYLSKIEEYLDLSCSSSANVEAAASQQYFSDCFVTRDFLSKEFTLQPNLQELQPNKLVEQ